MRTVTLPDGQAVPALGLGTWRLGEAASRHRTELAALRRALELGYRLIDTAEMYGEGGAEYLVGEALAQAMSDGSVRRDEVFIVSKVYPHNASAKGTLAACEHSLQRLQLDHIDLYLLHWRGSHPLAETLAAFETLQDKGRIRYWGVSNFDLDDMQELAALPGGTACAANQVYYSLSQRGVEFDLAPWQRVRGMPLMAYSPLDQGALADHPSLRELAQRHRATPTQIALAWATSQLGVIAIPKAGREPHLRDNFAALEIVLDDTDRALLDRLFPPPKRRRPLAMT